MKTLTALYDSFYTPPQTTDAHAEIEALHKQLILKLAKPERRLVLRLIDAKDHLAEEKSIDSFTCGFRLAWRLANELNSYPRTRASHPVRTDRAGRPCRAAGAMEPPRQGGYTSRAQTTPCWPLCARLWASLRRRIGRAGKQPEFPTSYGRYSGRTRYRLTPKLLFRWMIPSGIWLRYFRPKLVSLNQQSKFATGSTNHSLSSCLLAA